MESNTVQYPSPYDPLYINEKPSNGGRLFLELWFYFAFLASNFQNLTPLGSVQYGLGGLIALTGGLFFMALLISRKSIPFSIWIAILMNIPVNLAQYYQGDTPIIGPTGAVYWQHVCFLATLCYLVENETAAKRIALFFGGVVVAAVFIGGYEITSERIGLEQGVGQSFRNANDLAHISAFFSMACLFWSLKVKPYFRPVYWIMALLLFGALLKAVSRGGVLVFGCGLVMLLLLIVSGKGQRLTGIVLIVFGVIAVLLFSTFLSRYAYLLSERAGEATGRERVYSLATLREIMENPIFGVGNGAKLRAAGLEPHNTFIAMFFYYGGIAGLLYSIWLIVLMVRLRRAFFCRELPIFTRFFLVTLFGASILAQLLSNQAQLFPSCVFATVLLEKYLPAYSASEIRKRQLAAYEFDSMAEISTDNPPQPAENWQYDSKSI